ATVHVTTQETAKELRKLGSASEIAKDIDEAIEGLNVGKIGRQEFRFAKRLDTILDVAKPVLKNPKIIKAVGHLVSAGKHISKPVLGLLFLLSAVGTAEAAVGSVQAAAVGDVTTASAKGASATADVIELTPTPAGAVVGAGRAGWAIGEAINVFLSEETQDAIGGTINETLEHGWENVRDFYFGWAFK